MTENSSFKQSGLDLLNQFELILESDPLIDEVGFIHPSQFVTLNQEVGTSLQSRDVNLSPETASVGAFGGEDTNFWIRDHKLGISTNALLPLYKEAKDAFVNAITQYKRIEKECDALGDQNSSFGSWSLRDSLEYEVMKHSKALLLLSSDFGTAWNSRKLIVSRKLHVAKLIDELLLSALVLSYSPKSEQAWCHRRWVIKIIAGNSSLLQEIVGKESELVEKIAERFKMNYRAWNHRCWLVSFMTREQVLHELNKSKKWAGLHVADNSCFHHRTRLLLRILEESCNRQEDECSDHNVEICKMWQEELEWNEVLIKRYVGREALWLHRRFLSLYWIKKFSTDFSDALYQSGCKPIGATCIDAFLDSELHLVSSCSTIPDNNFEDFQAQAIFSATYILWLTKQFPNSQSFELKDKLSATSLKEVLNMACPEKSSLWSILTGILEPSN